MNRACTRPIVPPIAWLAAAMWAGSIVGEAVSWGVWAGNTSWLRVGVVACSAAIGCALVASVPRGRSIALLLACGVCAGVVVSGAQGVTWHRECAIAADGGAREWAGVVEADPSSGQYGASVRVRVTGGPLDGAVVRVSWPEGSAEPELGRVVRFAAILRPLPSDAEWARRVSQSGVCASGRAWRADVGQWRTGVTGALLAWRARVLARLHGIPGAGGELLEGIVLGNRQRLIGTVTDEDFRILGLSHLVAVSGSHLALACGAVALIGRSMRIPRRALTVLTLSAGAAYAVVTGLPYSALRSLLMLVVAAVAILAGRRGSGLDTLSISVIAVLAAEPWAVFDLGFQLSVLAVGALLLFGGLATSWVSAAVPGPLQTTAATLGLTVVAQAFTMPVVASAFKMFSVAAPVANAYAGPAVSCAMFVGLTGALVSGVAPGLGLTLARAAASVLGATAWLSHQLARVPGAAVALDAGLTATLAIACGAALLWVVWPIPVSRRQARGVGVAVLVLSFALALGPAPANRAGVVVLDVGQGDAILVQDAGRNMLVDTGADPTVMRAALATHGVRRLDVVVLTHAHDDHTGGAAGLSGVARVGWIGVPSVGDPAISADGVWPGPDVPIQPLSSGDEWRIGSIGVRVLWPPVAPDADLGTNDTSVVLALSCGDFDTVLTGDAEAEAQSGMITAGVVRQIEVLKVPHHGSTNGLTAEALRLWRPSLALVSVGVGNRFGHPSPETLGILDAAGVRVLRTDLHGEITVSIGDDGYRVRCARDSEWRGLRARMRTVERVMSGAYAPGHLRGCRGSHTHRRPETGLPHLQQRGSAARARAPPPA